MRLRRDARVAVDAEEVDLVGAHQVADDLADPAVADDDDARGRRELIRRRARLTFFPVPFRGRGRQRESGIRAMDRVTAIITWPPVAAGRICAATAAVTSRKANSPPGPSIRPISRACRRLVPNSSASPAVSGALISDHAERQPERRQGMGDDLQRIEAGADRDEEQAEQQAFERVDGDLDGAADIRFPPAGARR